MRPHLTFRQVDPRGGPRVTAQLYDGFPTPSVSSGWTTVQRPKDVGITDWQGGDPITMDIPLMFDGFDNDNSVEHDVHTLYRMMRNVVKTNSGDHHPAVLELRGVPVPYHGLRWVLNNISPEGEERRASDGHRTRFIFTASLLEYVESDILVRSPAKRHHRRGFSGLHDRFYTVHTGDDLVKIAALEYGNGKQWQKIAIANNLRSPGPLKVGRRLRIPR